ncbi:hypothetical protein FOZ60_016923 [Perkinsus olseni]|uniref:Uncharacterized protein n=1 Tax=Perkinsus olseni TaxID=32597 RepID=A0A7J6P3I1_PEROL|nr:hypothetical protein FOZ60_016923 [Perkinsus olseni]
MKSFSVVTTLLLISGASAIEDDGLLTSDALRLLQGNNEANGPVFGENFNRFEETAICVYILEGVNDNGVYQESPGIRFLSNSPGYPGRGRTATVQLNVVDLPGTAPQGGITVETASFAFVGIEFAFANFTWTIAPSSSTTVGTDDGVPVAFPISFEGHEVPEDELSFIVDPQELSTTAPRGVDAHRTGLRLVNSAPSRPGSLLPFQVTQEVSIKRKTRGVRGWEFDVSCQVVYTTSDGVQHDDTALLASGFLNG